MAKKTDTTEPTETGNSLSESNPVTTGAAAICMGLAFLLMGNAFLERGIELLASADSRS